jgi:hypothetical protein
MCIPVIAAYGDTVRRVNPQVVVVAREFGNRASHDGRAHGCHSGAFRAQLDGVVFRPGTVPLGSRTHIVTSSRCGRCRSAGVCGAWVVGRRRRRSARACTGGVAYRRPARWCLMLSRDESQWPALQRRWKCDARNTDCRALQSYSVRLDHHVAVQAQACLQRPAVCLPTIRVVSTD